MRCLFLLSAIGWLAGPASAFAGVVVTSNSTGLAAAADQGAKVNTLSLDGDRVRMESADGSAMIYRGDLRKVWMIHPADRTYREMTPESMAKMRARMDQARQRMQQQLQSMPEEQRKRVEAMMAQQGGGPQGAAGSGTPTYEKAGSARTVGSWSCTPYKVDIGLSGREEFCIARLGDVGLDADDLKGMTSFSGFMRQGFAPSHGRPMEAFDFAAMTKAIGFEGIPVQTTHYGADGKVDSQNTVKTIDRKSLSNGIFDLPAGYTKEEMMPPDHMGPPAAKND